MHHGRRFRLLFTGSPEASIHFPLHACPSGDLLRHARSRRLIGQLSLRFDLKSRNVFLLVRFRPPRTPLHRRLHILHPDLLLGRGKAQIGRK